jgi:predicted Zn-dependent protease
MTARLADHIETDYEFKLRVFNHEMVNAFAVPGGHMVLFDGLLQASDTAEEVTGVLGHEMGHVVNRDPTRLALRSAGSAGIVGMVFGDFVGGAAAVIVAEQLVAANYAQDAESKADIFATETLTKAGLPTKPFAGFFLKLKEKYGDDEGLLSHIASHPALGDRADAAIAANVVPEDDFVPVLTETEWAALKAICKDKKKPKDEEGDAGAD